MKQPILNIKTVDIDSLEFDPFNVREHDERNVDAIKESIARFGQQKPIVVKKDGTVIAGNGTLGAMRMLGFQKIVIAETDLEGEEAVAFAIADNRTAELANWDEQALAQALDQLDDDILPASGFNDEELAELMDKLEPSNFDIEEKDQSLQLEPTKEYVIVLCDTEEEWQSLRKKLGINNRVRLGGYKQGSEFDAEGDNRLIKASDLMKKVK